LVPKPGTKDWPTDYIFTCVKCDDETAAIITCGETQTEDPDQAIALIVANADPS
jgi:hypothetical protein